MSEHAGAGAQRGDSLEDLAMGALDWAVRPADLLRARERLRGAAILTPLIESSALGARLDGRALVKFEGAQREGSFKFRGAFNRLVQLSADERQAGVVAWSSGNHAQGVAAAARQLGIPATIVMPSDAPTVKLHNTRALGARIVPYDRRTESREEIARALVRQTGAVLVPSYDDPDVIAGQGSVGLEIVDQAVALGADIDQVLVPCGGGGLIAGVAMAIKAAKRDTRVYSVEPDAFDDHARSLAAGRRVANRPGLSSICDALLAPEPGELTFPINRCLLAGGVSVSDDEVQAAMAFAFRYLRLVVEPGGAVALAAALFRKVETSALTTVIVISGSNVDPDLHVRTLACDEGL